MDDWLAGYEHVPITSCTGPGTYVGGTAFKLVLHTTESGAGSTNGIINFFRSNPCSCPHFTIDPSDGRRVQHIPLSQSAAALRGGRGGFQTNRAHAVQVEIIGRANETEGWSDEWLAFLGEFIADLVRAGVPIDLGNLADFNVHGTVAIEGSPYRMDGNGFHMFDGVCGHIHVPFNDHYDPFRINAGRVIEHAQSSLGGSPIVPVPGPTPQPPPPAASYGEGIIGPGMEGGVVKYLQELLAGLGYDPGVADGIFGPNTEAAVKAFQQDAGLDVDGLVGPQTSNAIAQRYGSQPAPDPAQPAAPGWPGRYLVLQDPLLEGDDVRAWQQRMADRGWNQEVDGYYGPHSAGNCRAFQREKGLADDGVVGPMTWAATWAAPIT